MKNIVYEKSIIQQFLMLMIIVSPMMIASLYRVESDWLYVIFFIFFHVSTLYYLLVYFNLKKIRNNIIGKSTVIKNPYKSFRWFFIIFGTITYIFGWVLYFSNVYDVSPWIVSSLFISLYLTQGFEVLITNDEIYYGTSVIEKKSVEKVEAKNNNSLIITLTGGKKRTINSYDIGSYIEYIRN